MWSWLLLSVLLMIKERTEVSGDEDEGLCDVMCVRKLIMDLSRFYVRAGGSGLRGRG